MTSDRIATEDYVDAAVGASGAPTDATYLVASAHAGLSAEVAVGATPGGELGGTWGSPTVDGTHSGSTHAAAQAAAEATAASALTGHTGDAVDAHDASAISFTPAGTIAATDVQAAIEEVAAEAVGGSGAPTDATYLVTSANAGLSAEVVVTAAALTLLDDASVAAIATTLGLGTGSSPEFAAVNIGDAADTTLARASAGNLTVEGNALYRAGGTDVPVTDGGTGSSTAAAARTALGVVNDPWTEIVKSVDQTVTNSSTLVDDTELKFTAVSGGLYHVELFVFYSANDTTGDFKYEVALPTVSGYRRNVAAFGGSGDTIQLSTGVQLVAATATLAGGAQAGGDAGDTPRPIWFEFMFRAGAATEFKWQFANFAASSGRTSTTRAGSVLRYRRLA